MRRTLPFFILVIGMTIALFASSKDLTRGFSYGMGREAARAVWRHH
jgi:hypothetical protein